MTPSLIFAMDGMSTKSRGVIEVCDIGPMQILEGICRFEECGAMERANKARRWCGEFFRYAIVTDLAKYNPAANRADTMKGTGKRATHFVHRSPHLP
ncbi:hypothetical protein CRG95_05645 [Escherichia sp. E4208]|nr:hypothetical protein CRG95_05645 [Escherichia sp. E4208]